MEDEVRQATAVGHKMRLSRAEARSITKSAKTAAPP
jgi:hypothetical protein